MMWPEYRRAPPAGTIPAAAWPKIKARIDIRLLDAGACRVYQGAAMVCVRSPDGRQVAMRLQRVYWIVTGNADPALTGARITSTCGDPACVAHLCAQQKSTPQRGATARARKITTRMAATNPWAGLLKPPKEF